MILTKAIFNQLTGAFFNITYQKKYLLFFKNADFDEYVNVWGVFFFSNTNMSIYICMYILVPINFPHIVHHPFYSALYSMSIFTVPTS